VPQSLDREIRTLESIYWSERDPEGLAFAPLAEAHLRRGQVREALDLLTDGMSRHPDYATGHVIATRLYFGQGMNEEAELAARRVLRLDPDNLVGLSVMASVLDARGESDAAAELKEQLLAVDPESDEARSLGLSAPTGTVGEELEADSPAGPELDDALASLGLSEPGADLEVVTYDLDGVTHGMDAAPDDLEALREEENGEAGGAASELALRAPEAEADPAPEEVMDLGALAPDPAPEEVMDLGALAPDPEPEQVMDLGALAPDPEPKQVMDLAALAPDGEPEQVMDLAALAPNPEPEEIVDLGALAPDPEPEQVMDLAALAPDAEPEEIVDLGALAPDPEPEEVMDLAALAPDPDLEEVMDLAALAPDPDLELDDSSTHESEDDVEPVELNDLAPDEVDSGAQATDAAADLATWSEQSRHMDEQSRHMERNEPVYTRTLAELYVKQGFVDKALGVYRHLLDADPGAAGIRARIDELESGAAAASVAHPPARQAPPPLPDLADDEDWPGDGPESHGFGGDEEVETLARDLAESGDSGHEVSTPFAWNEDEEADPAEPGSGIGDYFDRLLAWEDSRDS